GTLSVGYVTDISYYDNFSLIEDLSITNTSYTADDAEYLVQIPSSLPTNARLAIKNAADAKSYYWDDVSWEEIPSCLWPTALATTGISATTADIEWAAGDAETTWNISWGTPGYEPGDTDEIDTAVVNNDAEYQITGLTAQTDYDVYVQADCGVDGMSAWTGPLSISTSCIPGTIPFAEGFEVGYTHADVLGGCWTQEAISGTRSWTINETITTNNRTPRSGSFNISLQWNAENWIFYPLDLTAGTSYELKLYARQNATSGADIEAAYGTANNAAAMTTSIIASSAVTSGDYQEFSGYFTPTSDGVYYIGIKGTTTFTPNYLSINDISVDLSPSCLPPSDLASTGISTTTADIEWTAGDTETAWNISWGTPGYTPGDADEIDAASVINDAEYQIT